MNENDEERIIAATKESAYLVQYYAINEDNISIWASRAPTKTHRDTRFVFEVKLGRDPTSEVKTMEIFKVSQEDIVGESVWKIELDSSTNLVHFSKKYFEQICQTWRKRSNLFSLLKAKEFSEEKILKNFKLGEIDNDKHERMFEKVSKGVWSISGIPHRPDRPRPPFGNYYYTLRVEQNYKFFSRLTVSRVRTHIGLILPVDVYRFCRKWQEGKVRENFEWVVWNLQNSHFDVQLLWMLLNKDPSTCDPIFIKNKADSRKIGRLYLKNNELRFFVNSSIKNTIISMFVWMLCMVFELFASLLNVFFGKKNVKQD